MRIHTGDRYSNRFDIGVPGRVVIPSTAGENFQAAVGITIDEELTISSSINRIGLRDRAEHIRELVKTGKLTQEEVDSFSVFRPRVGKKIDYNKLAHKYKDDKSIDIPTDLELREERNTLLEDRRKYANDIFDRSTTGGKWAAFGGSMVGASVDPINAAAMVITAPVAGMVKTSRALYALSMFGRGAAIGAVTQAAIEPFVYAWKEEIGAEYTLKDAMFNVAAAGLLNGAVSGIAGFIGHKAFGDGFWTLDRPSLLQALKTQGMDDIDAIKIADVADSTRAKLLEYDLRNVDLQKAKDAVRWNELTNHYEIIEARKAGTITDEQEAMLLYEFFRRDDIIRYAKATDEEGRPIEIDEFEDVTPFRGADYREQSDPGAGEIVPRDPDTGEPVIAASRKNLELEQQTLSEAKDLVKWGKKTTYRQITDASEKGVISKDNETTLLLEYFSKDVILELPQPKIVDILAEANEKLSKMFGDIKDRDLLITLLMGRGLDEEDAASLAQTMIEANTAPDKKKSARSHIETLEETQEDMDNASHLMYKDLEDDIDFEDIDEIDKLYAAIDEDIYAMNDDGSKVSFDDMDADYQDELDELDDVLGCMYG